MAEILSAYRTSQRPSSAGIIQDIIDAPPFTFNAAQRTDLIKELLEDVGSSNSSRISRRDVPRALLALKTLGKIPTGSEVLATPSALSTLLTVGLAESKGKGRSSDDDKPEGTEALRCIANTLLLHEQARSTFIGQQVNGAEATLAALDRAVSPEQVFIYSRILFLSTVSRSSLILTLVEQPHPNLLDIIAAKLELCLHGILSGTPQSREGMTDLLKFCFNLLHHYPKMMAAQEGVSTENSVIGDHWHERLDGILPPLIRLYHALPPTLPSPLTNPLTHVINSLISIPVTASLRPIWFNSFAPSKWKKRSSPKNTQDSHHSTPGTKTSSSRSSSNASSSPPKPSTLDRALSVLSAGRRSLSLSRSPSPSPLSAQSLFASPFFDGDTVQRTHDLLDVAFSHYFPNSVDPDSLSVRERPKKEGSDSTLDELLSPLVVLLTRLCQADGGCRVKTREWIVPPDLDRRTALEKQPTLLGRTLRLMASVYHAQLKNAVGELLYECCDSDASTLSALVGYGNVAGFLYNKGVLSAPPPPSNSIHSPSSTSSSSTITPDLSNVNPITGIIEKKGPSVMDEMTEEEKEREMEKLFVLFDRLERTGGITRETNPIRNAIERSQGG